MNAELHGLSGEFHIIAAIELHRGVELIARNGLAGLSGLRHRPLAAAIRALRKAGRSSDMMMPMIATTTSSSTNVKAFLRWFILRIPFCLPMGHPSAMPRTL